MYISKEACNFCVVHLKWWKISFSVQFYLNYSFKEIPLGYAGRGLSTGGIRVSVHSTTEVKFFLGKSCRSWDVLEDFWT
jgi:hypothetical protein